MLIIDRFEGAWAIVEYNKQTFNLPRSLLPDTAMEGDVILITVKVGQAATKRAKEESKGLLDDFFDE